MAVADMELEEDLFFLELQLFDDFDGETTTLSGNSGYSPSFEQDHLSISEGPFESQDHREAEHAPKQTRKRMRHRHLKDSEGNWLIPMLHLPRIPKSDIRRSYGLMFENVYNSCDRDFAASFVDRLIQNNYVYVFSKNGRSQALTGPKDALTQLWFEKMNEAPDLVFSFNAERIKVRSDSTSVLSGTYFVRGTKVVHTLAQERQMFKNERPRINEESVVQGCENVSQTSSILAQASLVSEVSQVPAVSSAEDEMFPVPKAYSFRASGLMSFHIDGNCQIERIEMKSEDYLATLLSSVSILV